MINSKKNIFLLLSILFLAIFFRTIGFNWDQNQHLHPDERFLTMVLTAIKIPKSFNEYLDPQVSTLNPYNNDFRFFVYGTFPLNLTKITGEFLQKTNYEQIHFVGRSLTIIADVLIVLLIYLISKKIFNQKVGLLASFLYSICVLPIQLSHFYTADPFLNLFIVLSFYILIKLETKTKIILKIFFLSLFFATALACKISAIYFLPIIGIFLFFIFYKTPKLLFIYSLIFFLFTSILFRINQSSAFSSGSFLNWNLNPQFINNINELRSYDKLLYYPPGIQWQKTIPLVFPLKNIVFWGAGLPLGLIFIFSILYSIKFVYQKTITKSFNLFIILFWILFLFFYQGNQHVTTMRYFLPIYPFLCIISAFFICQFKIFKTKFIKILFFIILLIYPFCFISIYLKDNTRISASKWIYQNIPKGSTIATEYWDDSLPLTIGNNFYNFYNYQSFFVAGFDTADKIKNLKEQIKNSDYIILSSSRFYLPIPQNKDLYPLTSKYYQALFDGSLGFQKIAQFNSYPIFNDTNAEEAFTVYDHPPVYIFQKTSKLNLDSF